MAATDLDRRLALILKTGKTALEAGADSQRVETLLQRLARLLGVDELHLLFNYRALSATAIAGDTTLTRVVGIGTMGVDMRVESALGRYLKSLDECPLLDELEDQLRTIARSAAPYPRWFVVVFVGLACGAFCLLFGADIQAAARAGIGAAAGLCLKFLLASLAPNAVLLTTLCAALSSILAALPVPGIVNSPDLGLAMTASVLYLVPGVPMINALEDMLQGHVNIAMGRAVSAMLLSMAIALGLIFSLTALGATPS